MTEATLKQQEAVYSDKAKEYREKLGTGEFSKENLMHIIGNENTFYFELEQLIKFGFIRKTKNNNSKNNKLKIVINPIGRLNNIDMVISPFKQVVKEATEAIGQLEKIKKLITMETGHH